MRRAVCPGSFDPVTLGHLDIIGRASNLYDEVVVAVGMNPSKKRMFSFEERTEMLREATSQYGNVVVDSFDGLIVDFCKERSIQVIVKGLRAISDFDYELHPTLDKHPQDGAPILREQGYPETLIEAVLSHAEHLSMPRDTQLKKTLFACDELSGFVHACGLVRPDGIETLEPKSVRKKLKQPSFASGVNRDDVYKGAEELGVELDDHIRFVIAAMRPIAPELGLRTQADAA